MSIDLWISIALAIPLAIVANLATPKLQRWLDARLEKSMRAKLEEKQKARTEQLKMLRVEMDEVTKYRSDGNALTQMYLISLIKVAMYGAIGTIYGAIFPLFGQLSNWDGVGGLIGMAGAQVTALAVSMLIFATCARVMRIHKKVRDFESYSASTQGLIDELESGGA
ncbi:MAG: hypothetical protein Q7U82_16990 [Gammaproteobacteria bacterium]|nr:hypothetical protein [Gammaproteobacteria bacterium]